MQEILKTMADVEVSNTMGAKKDHFDVKDVDDDDGKKYTNFASHIGLSC